MPKATRDLTTVYTGLTASDFDKFSALAIAKRLTRSELAREAIKYYLIWQEQVVAREESAQIIQLLQKMNQSIDSFSQTSETHIESAELIEESEIESALSDSAMLQTVKFVENMPESSELLVQSGESRLELLSNKVESILQKLEERIEQESEVDRESARRLEQKFSALDMLINKLFVALSPSASDRQEDFASQIQSIGSKVHEEMASSLEVFAKKFALYRQDERQDYQQVVSRISALSAMLDGLLPKIAVEISLLHYVLWRNHPGEKEQKDQVFDLAQAKARQRVGRWIEELRGQSDDKI